jgi:hypothetical protein
MRAFFVGVVTAGLVGSGWGQVGLRPPTQSTLRDGQEAYPAPLPTGQAVLEEMSERAAVIFCGVVTAVRLPGDGLSGVVEVEFAVSDAVRGAGGGTYVVKEWAGLWRDGARYRVGDRRLMLLHAPGPGGLSSPVDGLDGAIPVGDGVDLRWLEARTLRGSMYSEQGRVVKWVAPAAASGPAAVEEVVGLMRGWEARRNGAR